MSDDPSTWWNFTTEQSVRLILEYMAVKPRAVIASSLSVRALSELKDTMERPSFVPSCTLGIQFIRDATHTKYPLCVVYVHDIEQVKRLLWWIQRTQPRAVQLRHVRVWSAGEVQQVLDVLFSDEPVVPDGVPLYTNLLEFSIDAGYYECPNIMDLLGKCSSLRKLDLSHCKSVESLEGVKHLTCLHSIKLCACIYLNTITGVENMKNLEHIDLSHSGVTSLAGLEHCTSLRTVILTFCKGVKKLDELRHLQHLEKADLCYMEVKNSSFLSDAELLRTLNVSYTSVKDLGPLQNCKALHELVLSQCHSVSNVEALRGLVNLKVLDLESTSVHNIEPLRGCTNLWVLDLSNSDVKIIGALQNMSRLETLNLTNTRVTDISPLSGCQQMRDLCLRDCEDVQSVAPLADMKELELLDICYTSVSDLTPLTECHKMRHLKIANWTDSYNLRPLHNMPELKEVCIITPLEDDNDNSPDRETCIRW